MAGGELGLTDGEIGQGIRESLRQRKLSPFYLTWGGTHLPSYLQGRKLIPGPGPNNFTLAITSLLRVLFEMCCGPCGKGEVALIYHPKPQGLKPVCN